MARLDLEVVENNDPTLEFVVHQRNPLKNTTKPVNLNDVDVVECYVKASKDVADADGTLYSSDNPTQIEIIDATEEEHGEDATGAVAKVFLNDMELGVTLWYHLDVVDDSRRLTYSYGKLKVVNV